MSKESCRFFSGVKDAAKTGNDSPEWQTLDGEKQNKGNNESNCSEEAPAAGSASISTAWAAAEDDCEDDPEESDRHQIVEESSHDIKSCLEERAQGLFVNDAQNQESRTNGEIAEAATAILVFLGTSSVGVLVSTLMIDLRKVSVLLSLIEFVITNTCQFDVSMLR